MTAETLRDAAAAMRYDEKHGRPNAFILAVADLLDAHARWAEAEETQVSKYFLTIARIYLGEKP